MRGCEELANLGEAVVELHVEVLAPRLEDESAFVRGSACEALGVSPVAVRESEARLLRCLQDEHELVRSCACQSLCNSKGAVLSHAGALALLLRDESDLVRWVACKALCQAREAVVPHLPMFRQWVQGEPERCIREVLIKLLETVGEPEDAALIRAARQCMKTENEGLVMVSGLHAA